MSLDALVDQSADLPLQYLVPGKTRMLEHQESRRNESDKPADGRRGRPGERRSARPSYANGERRAVPRPNRHRARAGGFVADMNPDVVYIGWQLGKEKGR